MSEQTALSRNGIPIRLTDERWEHIIEEHAELIGLKDEVLNAVAKPQRILAGSAGELLAVRMTEPGKALVTIYRESTAADGFVITAFVTRRLRSLDQRTQIWPSQI